MLGVVEQIGMALMIFFIMLGMGATIRTSELKLALSQPKPLLIGMISQFGLMPIIALGLAIFFDLPDAIALCLIMIGATPGGTTSNLFAYFARGDVALSISMTVASTIAAVFLMPLAILIYGNSYTSAELQVPMANIVVTLVLVMVPVALGMFILSKNAVWAQKLERVSGILGALLIAILIVRFLSQNRELFLSTPLSFILSVILLGLCGFLLGYLLAKLTKLPARTCRTISLETGIQNSPLTIAVIVLSFPAGPQQEQMLLLTAFYAFFIVVTSAIVAFGYRKWA